VLSGPSTGVVGAQAIGRAAGFSDLITFDMGGTSTDVALLQDGQCKLASEATVHGYPIKAPMLDIHTVGAGGGSIAYIDAGGLLKVGPRSCGADPGPVCYDHGNSEPAVTDANVVLQTLNPQHLLGGRMKIRQDLAKQAVGRLADTLGLGVPETAQGVLAVVTANMARAIRVISVQRGHDPRDYTLMAFGGAGPLHAARLARELDIHTVGAGGGSIAYIDTGGLLKVGPRSCGADPGPVCYDKGNSEAAVTDANVVLQTLNPEHLLGGRMAIKRGLAVAAVQGLADRLKLGLMETAQGILSVVTANMARAIRVISVQRGHDPRHYTLMAFGGAGPLHAARLARELDMRRVLVPANPGILCAMGLLLTDLRADFAVTRLLPVTDGAAAGLAEAFATLAERAGRWFEHEGIAPGNRRLTRTVDMRYHGQNYELGVALPDGAIGPSTLATLSARFAETHRQRYGFATDDDPVEIVTLRLEANGVVRKAELAAHPEAGPDASGAIMRHRDVWLPEAGDFVATPIYARERLRPGNRFSGPAVIEQMDATTLVPPGMTARVDRWLNLILEAA